MYYKIDLLTYLASFTLIFILYREQDVCLHKAHFRILKFSFCFASVENESIL